MHYVYILECSDEDLYIGCTKDLTERIRRHKKGDISATQNRLPIKLISYITLRDKYTAYNFEKYLKSGSGRAFIEKHLR